MTKELLQGGVGSFSAAYGFDDGLVEGAAGLFESQGTGLLTMVYQSDAPVYCTATWARFSDQVV